MEIKPFTIPYLDLEFLWDDEKKPETKTRQKEIHKLKFLNKGSAYSNATLKSTLCGIFENIEKLTSKTDITIT